MIAHLKNGKIKSLYGNKEHPMNRGVLCAKGASATQFEYDDKRLTEPLIRDGKRGKGKWREVSWSKAINYTANKLNEIIEEYGSDSVGLVTGCEAEPYSFRLHRRFMDAIGSSNYCDGSGLCYAPNLLSEMYTFGAASYDVLDTFDFFKSSKLVIIWNGNLEAYMGVPDAVLNGDTDLIVIDPRLTPIASKADKWVRIRPNTDFAMALAMINVIIEEGLYDKEFIEDWTYGFDKLKEHVKKYKPEWAEKITDVDAETIKEVARIFASKKPAWITPNVSCHHSQYFQNARALSILETITGNIDIIGAKQFYRDREPKIDERTLTGDKRFGLHEKRNIPKHEKYKQYPAIYNASKERTVIDNAFMEEFWEGNIKALICDASNFVVRKPNYKKAVKGIKNNLDLLVVYDVYMNETGELADVIFPSTTFLERNNFSLANFNKEGIISVRQKLVEPPGECKSRLELYGELAEKMGFGDDFPFRNNKEIVNYMLDPLYISFEELREKGIIKVGEKAEERLYEEEGFKTPTGKVEIYSSILENFGVEPLPTWHDEQWPRQNEEFPLIFSSFTPKRQHSWSTWSAITDLEETLEENRAYIHKSVAEEKEIKDGDWIKIQTKNGSAEYKAKVSERMHSDSVIASRGEHQEARLIDIHDNVDPVTGYMGERGIPCKIERVN